VRTRRVICERLLFVLGGVAPDRHGPALFFGRFQNPPVTSPIGRPSRVTKLRFPSGLR
jgi:hypothetical protein